VGIPKYVELTDVEFGANFVDHYLPLLVRKAKANVSVNALDNVKRTIKETVFLKGYITYGDIYRLARGCDSRLIEDAIKQLEISGDIRAIMYKGHLEYRDPRKNKEKTK
jgi:hypothetical protein